MTSRGRRNFRAHVSELTHYLTVNARAANLLPNLAFDVSAAMFVQASGVSIITWVEEISPDECYLEFRLIGKKTPLSLEFLALIFRSKGHK